MKNNFFKLKELLQILETELAINSEAKWGQMNAHNMVEHLGFVFLASTGKFGKKFTGDPEKVATWKSAFFSAKHPFPKGIKMPGTKEGQAPPPLRHDTIEASKVSLKKMVQKYLDHYNLNPKEENPHPFLGQLSFDEWTLFHLRHIEHHLRQFGILTEPS